MTVPTLAVVAILAMVMLFSGTAIFALPVILPLCLLLLLTIYRHRRNQ